MIIKDKPFRVPSSSCVLCAWYFPAAVVGYAARPRGYSDFDYASLLRWVRRSPDFSRLEAYQVRLSRLLAKRWGYVRGERELKQINGSFAIFPEWDSDIFDFRDAGGGFDDPDGDGLMHSGVFL